MFVFLICFSHGNPSVLSSASQNLTDKEITWESIKCREDALIFMLEMRKTEAHRNYYDCSINCCRGGKNLKQPKHSASRE